MQRLVVTGVVRHIYIRGYFKKFPHFYFFAGNFEDGKGQ
jgi:hypothetical protein